ncbi:Arm DNA-binding domain-containing protein, partial [Escherichia coli]|uniref:Arm DNA-binding domain-containing protein n=1 Tax=Escherichia coli TaxID=562 RepID=UPI00203E08E8
MALTDAKIRAAKPTDKAYKLTDGAGMFLLVHPNGSRYWRLRYRILGKEKTLALGVYPEVSLSEARTKRDEARKLISEVNRPGFPGECFICELRLPDHRFRWKHNKLFLLLPEE